MEREQKEDWGVEVIDLPTRLVQLGCHGFAGCDRGRVTLYVGAHLVPAQRVVVAAELVTLVATREHTART